jgi:hypothetical protein
VKKLTLSVPSKYPAIEENTTLTDKRILVISVKFLTTETGNDCDRAVGK